MDRKKIRTEDATPVQIGKSIHRKVKMAAVVKEQTIRAWIEKACIDRLRREGRYAERAADAM